MEAAEQMELPPESRNGQSTCNDEDFARMIAERLESKNFDSQAEDSLAKSIPVQPSPPTNGCTSELVTTHDVGLSNSFEEGKGDNKMRIEEKREEQKPKAHSVMIGPEDSKYIIRDTVTGVAYDIRSQSTALMLSEVDQMLTKLPGEKKKKPWEEWWREKRERNYQLMNAAERGDKDQIVNLLDESIYGDLAADINAKGLDDFTALHFAVSEGQIEAVELLLSCKAPIEAVTTSLRTPLHIACNRGNLEIIEILVAAGANINAQDKDGNTPTHILSNFGWIDALNWLLTKGPDLSIKNIYGETAIETAASVETRQIFSLHTKVPDKGDSYSRTVMEGVILHNNRADMVKSFMFRAQLLGAQSQPPKPEAKVEVKPPPPQKQQSRIVRILEVVNQMKELPSEERKGSPKGTKGNGSENPLSRPKVQLNELRNREEEEDSVGPEHFDPLHLLGKGSFGEVYLVRYKPTGKFYAMKVLNKRKVRSQNLIKYARTERNVMCVTRHPFIVGLHFAFQNSEKLFMVMEYCPGYIILLQKNNRGDLGRMVQKERRLTEDRARIYIAEILLGLEDLHKRDIIFRDLKPDNVVLDEDGHALLTDFGLSKEGVMDNISAKSFCGSVAYLAPEMLRRTGHGKSVDWYLLGVLLYELVVGQPPYFTSNREQLFKNIQTAPLKLPMFLSAEIKNLLIALLNRNPQKRLGAGKLDADEIKAHPWFKGVKWDDVLKRKMKLPKPHIKPVPTDRVLKGIFVDTGRDEDKIAGWNFKEKTQFTNIQVITFIVESCVSKLALKGKTIQQLQQR
eukprot:TRINITY_DN59_c0_g7_i1.p1 TRINITY_DN59_c0_g7~~TRINITY_DN59_c0_g7_i1.p1  ORF type:complete len:795 (+),score=65.68 TRINITY_DN59_c0_g7_i1:112-2496(+)